MDSDLSTGLEDDQHFFGSYAADQAVSTDPNGFDAAEAEPSQEQLVRLGRFRRPVALVVGTLALFSVMALGLRDSERASQRKLVAHYGAAIAAPTPANGASVGLAPIAILGSNSALTELFAQPEPRMVRAFVSVLTSMCWRTDGGVSHARPSKRGASTARALRAAAWGQ